MLAAITILGQQPEPTAAEASFWQWLWSVLREPGVIEIVLAATIVAVVVMLWWRLLGLVRGARAREALADYLLGVEQALQGDLGGAEQRLSRVLQQDPENHYARLLLGKVLGDLGHAEQAHQQHLYLQRAFGLASAENDLMLAQSLLGAGLPAEAADVAERALARAPNQAAGWDFVYRARLQSGDHEAAAIAGRKLLALVRDDEQRSRLRQDLARTFAEAGTLRWLHGDGDAARRAVREAATLDEQASPVALLSARLQVGAGSLEATARQLLATEDAPAASGPRALAIAGQGQSSPGPIRLPVATFAGLVESSRWLCRACGVPLERAVRQCPRCAAADPATLCEPELVAAIASATELMDQIDSNEAHVQRLVRALLQGDPNAPGQLLPLGERAVEELLRVAWKHTGDQQEQALAVLREMGPVIAPALFAASDVLGQQRLLSVGGRGPAAIVGRLVQGFDRSALPHIEVLFASARPDHRKILIDYFLGLADLDAFQSVLKRFPPMEILQGFNSAEPSVLQRFLQVLPRGHFLSESLLLEPTFYRDEAVLAAVPDADEPEVLVDLLLRRGPSRTLTKVLISGIVDERLAETSERILRTLGERVLEHVLAAYADPDQGEAARERLRRVLVYGGAAAAVHIADSFGPEATQFDEQLRGILVAIGDAAVAPLLAAYEQSGWLEKVSVGLLSRHNNRRVQIVRTFGELGSGPALAALYELHERERDDNLRLQLSRALHGSDPGDGDARG